MAVESKLLTYGCTKRKTVIDRIIGETRMGWNPPDLECRTINVDFNPPLCFGSIRWLQTWDILNDMQIGHKVIITTHGPGDIHRLSFDNEFEAILFRLRLE